MVTLESLRLQIEEVDRAIINFLKQRSEISKHIGHLKRDQDLPIFDPLREAQYLEILKILAKEKELDPIKVSELFTLLFEQSKDEQQK
jgi:chorismate mutase